MVKILAEGLNRVEIVFAQGKGAGGRGGPGVHQRHLHHVILVRRTANVGAPVLDVNVDLRHFIKVVGVAGVTAAHHVVDDERIDFDSGHAGTAIGYGTHDVHAAARADNGVVA